MTAIYVLVPYFIFPFLVSLIVKKAAFRRKSTYLITALLVPLWPLLLVQLQVLPHDGLVFVGTSVFLIPAVLFVQYLANRVFLKIPVSEVNEITNG